MRLAKLVAAGLALGAAAGFVGALLRPRSVHRRQAADAVHDEPTAEPPPAEPLHVAEPLPEVDVRALPEDPQNPGASPLPDHSLSAGVQ